MLISHSENKFNYHYTPRAYPINPNNLALWGLEGYLTVDCLPPVLFAAIQLWCR